MIKTGIKKDSKYRKDSKKIINNFDNRDNFQYSREAVEKIKGPLVYLKPLLNPLYGGLLKIKSSDGNEKTAQIIDVSDEEIIAQVFEGTYNLQKEKTIIIDKNNILKMELSTSMLGKSLNGLGVPKEPTIKIVPEIVLETTSDPINPYSRDVPKFPIETGVTAIDGLNTLVKGQKLPIFTGPGLPANELAVRIAKHIASYQGENTIVVFAAMGITNREGTFFRQELEKATGSSNIGYFLNYVDDPTVERILTPRCALTFAEYLAFKKNKDVIVILTDILNYAEALREISAAREEIPGRRGFPGYLYTDLATIFERAGRIKGYKGSLTQIPIISMPNNDITHPVPDLSGYITEGQIVLSDDLYYKGIDPPIDILPSLSRLMVSGIGERYTREDHKYVSNQLYAVYAEGRRLRQIISISGEESLTEIEKIYLKTADIFEFNFINSKPLNFIQTLDLGWKILGLIPKLELIRIPEKLIDKYYAVSDFLDFKKGDVE